MNEPQDNWLSSTSTVYTPPAMPKQSVSRKTTAAQKELEHESTRMAACLCAAIDATRQAANYAAKKGAALCFSSDNISSIGLSLYIRRRDEAKSANNNFSKARP